MSNLIPPLLSSSPPPITGPVDEEDDDEFGDFRAAADSYNCDEFSLPPSPQQSPERALKNDFKVSLDINSNNSQKITSTIEDIKESIVSEVMDKDFQDRRKSVGNEEKLCEIEVNCSNSKSVEPSVIFDTHDDDAVPTAESLETLEEQIVAHENVETVSTETGASNDQISEINDSSNVIEDDFDELQCGVPSPLTNCDEIQHDNISNVEIEPSEDVDDIPGQSDSNSFTNEDCSESAHLEKTNLDELSEINEIKSEDDCSEEINFEITNEDLSKDNASVSSLSLKVCDTDPKLSDDEFGDFENHFAREMEAKPETDEDEFDAFVSQLPPQQELDDDFGDFESSDLNKGDFGAFGDFSTHSDEPVMMDIDMKDAAAKSETILKEIFPGTEEDIGDFVFVDETKGNVIFDELKDVTETNALIYQWSKSNSQKMFLKALNIDMRNILYGPAWNCSMPRFAANLGLTPLEPVRSEILTPTPVQNVSSPSNSSQKNVGDIPTAQFDWSGSGLINPLDSTSTEPRGSVPEDSTQTHVKTDFLPTSSEKPEPISSLFDSLRQSTKEQTPATSNFELPKPPDDFAAFQSPKMIPLRETHISNENTDFGNKPGWLQPTILTPDLPRKEQIIDEDDDEFDDFQMVLPEDIKDKVAEAKNDAVSLPDLSEFDVTLNSTSHNQEHIPEISATPYNSGPTVDSSVQKLPSNVNKEEDDDEFTDFHSSLPPPEILKPLQPVPMEPLKPSIQYTVPLSTQINWPDPGVTDEDIRNIELNYSRNVEKSGISKESSVDDDEWSDFVSVTNPLKSAMPERTATPDLPLSVLNLNNVQAPKQPIPVITQSGLVQTKLSANMMRQPKSSKVVQTTLQSSNMFKLQASQFQPSIISNQFAANLYQDHSNSGGVPSGQAPKVNQAEDDDDWTDFVSSQPLPNTSNGYEQKMFGQGKAAQVNWANATPNIITNPSHYDSFQSYVPQPSKKVSAMPARNTIPSISAMPDLDFIAPKNRTSRK